MRTRKKRKHENTELSKAFRILATESERHARIAKSRYKTFEKPESINEGVKGLLSLLNEEINKVKEKASPVEILREGIEIEKHLEQLYEELADNYELEGELDDSLGRSHEGDFKASKIFREIAADEKKHQEILQSLPLRIAKVERPK